MQDATRARTKNGGQRAISLRITWSSFFSVVYRRRLIVATFPGAIRLSY